MLNMFRYSPATKELYTLSSLQDNSGMYDENDESWEDHEPIVPGLPQPQQIQKLLAEMELKAKKAMDYLVTEGFLEPTDTPGEYKYTPEGLVLAQQQYKQMKEDGLI